MVSQRMLLERLTVEKDFNMYLYDFENGMNFKYYFPQNNMEKVIANLKSVENSTSNTKKNFKKRKLTSHKIDKIGND